MFVADAAPGAVQAQTGKLALKRVTENGQPATQPADSQPPPARPPTPARPVAAEFGASKRPATPTPPRDGVQPGRLSGRLLAVARQAALDHAGFSPGLIDGAIGPKTRLALRTFQQARGLPATGEFDEASDAALSVHERPATIEYVVTSRDLASVGPVPTDWNAKSRLSRLDYESLEALLAERGHCTRAELARLNPGRSFTSLVAGDRILLPNVGREESPASSAAAVEVDLSARTVRAIDGQGRTLALFHCSIAKYASKRPKGDAVVRKIAWDPEYTFDPKMWPEVRSVKTKLTIPPGPRNPVGLCWIGLSLPGYGIHGTPAPELIGKTGSHGCIRLANWDVLRLAKMIKVDTRVRFVV